MDHLYIKTLVPIWAEIGCLRFTNIVLGWKRKNIIMKPKNSPTQGQPNPKKIGAKVAFGPLFSHGKHLSWVGIGFIYETDYKKANPTKFSTNTPMEVGIGVLYEV